LGPALKSSLAKARRLKAHEWLDIAVAADELAIARFKLGRTRPRELVPNGSGDEVAGDVRPATIEHLDRVRLAIARASRFVPWRADCLVQAMAARRWLHRHGIPTILSIGVAAATGPDFEAHAWLSHGGHIVTGGDVTRFVALNAAADVEAAD